MCILFLFFYLTYISRDNGAVLGVILFYTTESTEDYL